MRRSGDRSPSTVSSAWSTAAARGNRICSRASRRLRTRRRMRSRTMKSLSRHAPLAMDADTFSTIGHQLVDQLSELLAAVPSRPVTIDQSPSSLRTALNTHGPLPEAGADPATLVADTARQLFDYSLMNAHPRFFGYITSPPAPIGILGDFLASALNANVGSWTLGPAATEIETQ